jgi:hypothetical protein
MTSGDFLLAVIVLGLGLCLAYFRAELLAFRERREREIKPRVRQKGPWDATQAR